MVIFLEEVGWQVWGSGDFIGTNVMACVCWGGDIKSVNRQKDYYFHLFIGLSVLFL